MRFVTGFLGAVSEAWAELRIHKTRVMLSLVGVGVAVTAITTVVGLGGIVQQSTTESMERGSGRPATISIYAYKMSTGEQVTGPELEHAIDIVVDRYQIGHSTAIRWTASSAQFDDGVRLIDMQAVDVDYGTMHRMQVAEGSWFTDFDETRLAPAVVVNDKVMNLLGSPSLDRNPTLKFVGENPTTAVIVGVVPSSEYEGPVAFILDSAYQRITPPSVASALPSEYKLWVPAEIAEELAEAVRRDLAGVLGSDVDIQANRQDYAAWNGPDPLLPLKLLVAGVAALVLLLGALGLVNISLVTVRQRIREIGIRRSFGATAGRVFFAVMMESVVASFAAGVIGVLAAILIVNNPMVQQALAQGVLDTPAFPLEAALVGLGAATAVGALAGLLPALVAVRVKVIDAIRF
ncbi:ABC transporter permease [Salinibacterium hongtaonis]|uniref:ABC transporter permease n=1 Tax=Homoserinimonas hongtaonis TaxID=2079791 RepID=A0A2U1SXN1_9MICO|nr:ABC transporter permease [Salinibacterium hongtaonis]AWB88905.1 ABC transporter permease [Salinibacterium hongtaonis]PWB96303.1 ABC transporter permease [Salinibacterium hongtaonis]